MMTKFRFALLSAIATAVLLVPATAAHSQIEAVNEGTVTEACSPCDIHMTGESHITGLPSGVVLSSCQDDFEGTIDQNGTGEVSWTGTAHDAPGCTVVNCTAPGEDHWPLGTLVEAEGEARITMRLCYRGPTGVEVHCDVVLSIPASGTHEQQVSTDDLCVSNTRRVEGVWQTESMSHDALEVVHGEGSQVELLREVPDQEPCNPCDVHLTGESHVTAVPSGIEMQSCQDEFEGTINHDATGNLSWTGTAHDAVGCTLLNCAAADESQWPLIFPVEESGTMRVTMRLCYSNASGAEVHCDIVLAIPEAAGHAYEVSADELCLSNTRRVEGSWQIETGTHDEIEFIHSAT